MRPASIFTSPASQIPAPAFFHLRVSCLTSPDWTGGWDGVGEGEGKAMQSVQTGSCLLVAVRSLYTKKAQEGERAPQLQYHGSG